MARRFVNRMPPHAYPLSREPLIQTLGQLVRINSVNPAHGGPEGGEAQAMEYVAERLREFGIKSEIWEAMPGRPNLTARLRGRDGARTLLFETHLDTVSISGMAIDPFGAELREGRLWGRGATDAKAQATAMIHAFAAASERPGELPLNVELVLVSDEEAGFGGVNALVRRLRSEARLGEYAGAIVGEPTGLDIVVAHKGSARWWVEVSGRAAHSSKPELGVNAIRHAAALVEAFEGEYAARLRERTHEWVGSPTINVSKIEGGTQANLVPDRARMLLDRRMIPGETWEAVREEVEAAIETVRARFGKTRIVQEAPLIIDPCLEIDAEHALVRSAIEVARRIRADAGPCGVPYCTDASKLSAAGMPTIVAGPGSIDQAHTADEWMDLAELEHGAAFYFNLMSTGIRE
jgi:acetylornithine deacetylase/succinyl-diaminopimelate desuccinylase-like protein